MTIPVHFSSAPLAHSGTEETPDERDATGITAAAAMDEAMDRIFSFRRGKTIEDYNQI
jgi:hypothetical protein